MKKTTLSKKILRFAVASGLVFSMGAPLVQAMPQGGEVLNGGVWVNGSNRYLDNSAGKFDAISGDEFQAQRVNDANDKALIIKWDSFDIAKDEELTLNGQGIPFINIVNSKNNLISAVFNIIVITQLQNFTFYLFGIVTCDHTDQNLVISCYLKKITW